MLHDRAGSDDPTRDLAAAQLAAGLHWSLARHVINY
jgi:hypothetical protein